MPHFHPNEEDGDTNEASVASSSSKGADLLLSLVAATQSDQVQRTLSTSPKGQPVSPPRIPPQGGTRALPMNPPPQYHPMGPPHPMHQEGEAAMRMVMPYQESSGRHQLCPSPIEAQPREVSAESSEGQQQPYPGGAHHPMWMSSSPRHGMPIDYSMGRPSPHVATRQRVAPTMATSQGEGSFDLSSPANQVAPSFDSQDREQSGPLSSGAGSETRATHVNGQRIISPASSNEGPTTDKDESIVRAEIHLDHPPPPSYNHAGCMHPPGLPPPPHGAYCYPAYGYPLAPLYHQPYYGMMHPPPPPPPHHGSMYSMHAPPVAPNANSTSSAPPLRLQKQLSTNSSQDEPAALESSKQAIAARQMQEANAQWQLVHLATGHAPSNNRCIPIKPPVPARFWGKSDTTQDRKLPDFHLLVNYPDYITKGRSTVDKAGNVAPEGQKHCVMCGKLRICSNQAGRSARNTSTKAAANSISESSADNKFGNAMHIIPRQNKGVCTACDITVWVVMAAGQERLEIKWCKGCKNFRPWAAFGEKGLATKCVRCRDRQKEKYLWQKQENERRSQKYLTEEKKEEDSAMV